MIYCLLPKKSISTSNKRSITINSEYEKKLYFVRFICYFSIILTVVAILKNDFSIYDYLFNGDFVRASLTEDYDPGRNIFSLITTYFCWLAIPICALLIVKREKIKLWMLLPFIAIFIVSMISIGKYNLILTMAIFFNIWLLTKKIDLKSIIDLFKSTAVFMLLIVSIFYSTGLLRNTISDEVNYEDRSYTVSFLLFMYGFGHINNFTEYYNDLDEANNSSTEIAGFRNFSVNDEKAFGEITFSGIYRILYWTGLKDGVSYTRYEGIKNFNTYSILRNYIDDFGKLGSLVAAFFTGLITNLIFLMINKNSPSGIIFASLIFVFLQYTAIHSLFNFIFFYLMLIFAPIVPKIRYHA